MMNQPPESKIILTDVDHCLTSWIHSFHGYMDELGHARVDDHHQHFFVNDKYNIDFDHAEELVAEFNLTDSIKTLSPFKDSQEYVGRLKDEGFEFHAVTSIGTHKTTVANRIHNLEMLFGEDTFSSVNCIPVFGDKSQILKRWKDEKYMWIEDCPKNAEVGLNLGLFPILIMHPENAHSKLEVPRVSNENPWKEIYDMAQYYY